MDQPTFVEEGVNSWRDWESLPWDLLCLVLSRLPLVDLIRSATVCKYWRLAAGEVHDQPQLPWLWLIDTHQFYSISDDRFYTLSPFPHDLLSAHSCVIGVDYDWLILAPSCFRGEDESTQYYEYSYSLYNPFSATRIALPAVPADRGESGLVLSSSPLDPDCMAALLFDHKPCGHHKRNIGLCRVGAAEDGEWKVTRCRKVYADIVFYDKSLYVVTARGALKQVNTSSFQIRSVLPAPTKPPLPLWLKERLHRNRKIWFHYSLFVFQGQLMMVCSVPKSVLVPFAVFKADFELQRWLSVDSLGGQALFSDSDCGLTSMRPVKSLGIEGDCIYVTGYEGGIHILFRLSNKCMYECYEEYPPTSAVFGLSWKERHNFYFLTPKPNFTSC